jgi:hypothetical protein
MVIFSFLLYTPEFARNLRAFTLSVRSFPDEGVRRGGSFWLCCVSACSLTPSVFPIL